MGSTPNVRMTTFTIGLQVPLFLTALFAVNPPGKAQCRTSLPQYGFSSAAWDPPKWSTDQELVGSVETVSATFTPAALEGSGYTRQEDFGEWRGLRLSIGRMASC